MGSNCNEQSEIRQTYTNLAIEPLTITSMPTFANPFPLQPTYPGVWWRVWLSPSGGWGGLSAGGRRRRTPRAPLSSWTARHTRPAPDLPARPGPSSAGPWSHGPAAHLEHTQGGNLVTLVTEKTLKCRSRFLIPMVQIRGRALCVGQDKVWRNVLHCFRTNVNESFKN